MLFHLKRHLNRKQMTLRVKTRWVTLGACIAVFCTLAEAQQTTGSAELANSIIESMEKAQAGSPSHVPYMVIRSYRLFRGSSSTADSEVVAAVDFKPPAAKRYEIQNASGS